MKNIETLSTTSFIDIQTKKEEQDIQSCNSEIVDKHKSNISIDSSKFL